jgi:hypothetical protein
VSAKEVQDAMGNEETQTAQPQSPQYKLKPAQSLIQHQHEGTSVPQSTPTEILTLSTPGRQ